MKNKVNALIILISILLITIAIVRGISIGEFKILSISEINEKAEELDTKINKASQLTSTDYPDTIQTLEETFEKYSIKKQKYEELAEFADEKKEDKYEKKQYDIGYLWRILGKNANARNLTLGIDVKSSTNTKEKLYDLNFSVSGQYVNISQFIADLENNSDLFFRIYNFKMSGAGEIISATFTVKNVNIDPSTLNTVS